VTHYVAAPVEVDANDAGFLAKMVRLVAAEEGLPVSPKPDHLVP
jgi:hypothetical protein